LVPSFDGGDNFVWILCPAEGTWLCVGFRQEAIDCGLKFNNRAKYATLETPLG
jgi:hypothetical protein